MHSVTVPTPSRGDRRGKDERNLHASRSPPAPVSTVPDLGAASGLLCRECGAQADLGPSYACSDCFGPLEVRYDFGPVTRQSIEAGPHNIWRYRELLPVPAGIADIPNIEPGWTPLVRAHNLGRELGLRSLWVKDDSANPTHSFKDRVVAVARPPRASSASPRWPVRRPATWRTRLRLRRPGPGSGRWCWCPPTWSSRRS